METDFWKQDSSGTVFCCKYDLFKDMSGNGRSSCSRTDSGVEHDRRSCLEGVNVSVIRRLCLARAAASIRGIKASNGKSISGLY